jgi:hypothetical protein
VNVNNGIAKVADELENGVVRFKDVANCLSFGVEGKK